MNINNDYIEATLRQYYDLKSENKLDEAREVLAAAAESNSLAAKLELARFLRQTPALSMTQNERYVRAEALYKDCVCQLDLPSKATAHIAHEMADLYSKQNRPLACLGFLLMARRYGAKISGDELENCKKQFYKIDINAPGSEQDVFVLALELYLDGTVDTMAEYFLRIAAESDNDIISGMGWLTLGEHYDRLSGNSLFFKKASIQCYRRAKEKGFPDYISPRKGDV